MKRRDLLKGAMLVSTTSCFVGSAQSSLVPTKPNTPKEMEGPYYPVSKPVDMDADLTRVKGRGGIAKGQIIHVSGRVLSRHSAPIAGANIDLWQANSLGKYHHPNDSSGQPVDEYFQSFAMLQTNASGQFRIKTVFPGAYALPGGSEYRTPHIHFKIYRDGYVSLTTQMYFPDHPLNHKDPLIKRKSPKQIALMTARELTPQNSTEQEFNWDIVLSAR